MSILLTLDSLTHRAGEERREADEALREERALTEQLRSDKIKAELEKQRATVSFENQRLEIERSTAEPVVRTPTIHSTFCIHTPTYTLPTVCTYYIHLTDLGGRALAVAPHA